MSPSLHLQKLAGFPPHHYVHLLPKDKKPMKVNLDIDPTSLDCGYTGAYMYMGQSVHSSVRQAYSYIELPYNHSNMNICIVVACTLMLCSTCC